MSARACAAGSVRPGRRGSSWRSRPHPRAGGSPGIWAGPRCSASSTSSPRATRSAGPSRTRTSTSWRCAAWARPRISRSPSKTHRTGSGPRTRPAWPASPSPTPMFRPPPSPPPSWSWPRRRRCRSGTPWSTASGKEKEARTGHEIFSGRSSRVAGSTVSGVWPMSYTVDFTTVSTVGLESSPVAPALAGLRANEARYFKNKYDHVFTVEPAGDAQTTIDYVNRILKEERDIVIESRPLEATAFQVENIRMAYVFYESGLSINVMYTIDEAGKRAVGFKLSDGMEIPEELASRFKFARQRSKLAGTIRGSYFAFKNDH